MLGSDIIEMFSSNRSYNVTVASSSTFDITELSTTRSYIENHQPETVIHAAAYTDVDGCEENPDKAFKVNALGTRNVAIAARKVGAKLFYISTDYVFDGERKSSYKECNDPNPQSIYGKSKLLGEHFVKEQLERFFICRIAWLYGKHGDNFVKTMLNLFEKRDELKVVDDQRGSPTWTMDVARQVKKLLETEAYGVYHCTSQGSCSWYEFALEIFKTAGLKVKGSENPGVKLLDSQGHEKLVKPVSSGEFSRTALRPANSVLQNYMLQLQDLDIMPHWKDSLRSFLEGNENAFE